MADDVKFVVPEGADFYYKPGEYALAKLEKRIEPQDPGLEASWLCRCIDGRSVFYVKERIAQSFLGNDLDPAKPFWVRLKFLKKSYETGARYVAMIEKDYPGNDANADWEFSTFTAKRSAGDLVRSVVAFETESQICVYVTPNIAVWVDRRGSFANARVGDTVDMRIASARRKDAIALVDPSATAEERSKAILSAHEGELLPESIGSFVIPTRVFQAVRETRLNHESLELLATYGIDLATLTHRQLCEFVEDRYRIEKNLGHVMIRPGRTLVIDFLLGLRSEAGAPMSAGFKRGSHDGTWIMNLYGFTNAEDAFSRCIYVHHDRWQPVLDEIATLALDECWDYAGGSERGQKYILKQYLRFTFYKAWLDGLVLEGPSGDAVFNTGLVDDMYDPIYCYLVKNENPLDVHHRPWAVGFFACWGKGDGGKRLNRQFAEKPKAPEYIDRNHLEDLIYDASKPLDCDYDHIIADNLKRLPLAFLERELSFDNTVRRLLDKHLQAGSNRTWNELRDAVVDNDECMRRISDALRRSVDVAIKYCSWNYKTAIPIYYPRTNGISLLLPLNLCGPDNSADVALVVSRLPHGNYQGETILDLPMAYMDARQICRPSSEWLTTNRLRDGDAEGI
jgi:hypothetical protein